LLILLCNHRFVKVSQAIFPYGTREGNLETLIWPIT
jgi:hypothetical protein